MYGLIELVDKVNQRRLIEAVERFEESKRLPDREYTLLEKLYDEKDS
jgi:hypothetical protein